MANINQISPDGGTTVYDIEDTTARGGVNSLTPRVGIAEGKISTLEGQMLSVQDDLDDLGTASTKNSTSVVTQSTDLVESGAVKDIVGWGNKNLLEKLVNQYSWIGNQGGSAVAESGGVMKITTSTLSGTVTGAYSSLDNISTELNGTYTYSFDIKASSNMACDIGFHGRGRSNYNITTEWQRINITSDAFDRIAANFVVYGFDGTVHDIYIKNLMIEKGSTATSYEPYHASVEESLEQKCDNSVIGTVEDGATASQAYAVGSHAIRNGAFITWKNAKAQGETINDVSDYTSGDVAALIPIRKRFRVQLPDITWSAGGDTYYGIVYEGASGTKILSVSLCDWSFQVNMLKIMPVIRGNDKDIIIISDKNTYNQSDFVDVVLTYI